MAYPAKRRRISPQKGGLRNSVPAKNCDSHLKPLGHPGQNPAIAALDCRTSPALLDEGDILADLRRRQEVVTEVETVVVDVVAQIDENGVTSIIETLPVVPTVAPFPSDLTVPPVPEVPPFPTPEAPVPEPTPEPAPEPESSPTPAPESPSSADSETTAPAASSTSGAEPTASDAVAEPTSTASENSEPPVSSPSTTASPSSDPLPEETDEDEEDPDDEDASLVAGGPRNLTTSTFTFLDGSTTSIGVTVIDLDALTSSTLRTDDLTSNTRATKNPSSVSRSATGADESSFLASSASSGAASTSVLVGAGSPDAGAAPGSDPSSSESGSGGGSSAEEASATRTAQVVGGVVGGLAGLAALLLLALLILRWYKRRLRNANALPQREDSEIAAPEPETAEQRSSVFPVAAAGLLNRFSNKELERGITPPPERGFQRISGRKLPSAFSGGAQSDGMSTEGHLSDKSFPDVRNTFGGPGYAFGFGAGESSARDHLDSDNETIRASPARTPVIHHARPISATAPLTLSPPHTPLPGETGSARGTLGRSHPSYDGSRGSRFTEDV